MSESASHPPLRILLVDDEAPARMRLRDLLGDIADELPTQIAGEAADGIEALECLAKIQATEGVVDVALVDIRMPKLDGIGLALKLAGLANSPAVIFTTAYDQYAVRAFELDAVDYLLKPVRATRLLAALQKAPRHSPRPQAPHARQPEGRQHLSSSERGRMLRIPLTDILYLRAGQKYVSARTAEREYLLEESLTHLEEEFAERFVRVHRNCLVARQAIRGVERELDSESQPGWAVLLNHCDERLPVSRRQWSQLKTFLKEET